MVIAGTGFDLDGIAIPGHDVDFAKAATPAPLENLVAASFQLFGGESFAALAKIAPGAPPANQVVDYFRRQRVPEGVSSRTISRASSSSRISSDRAKSRFARASLALLD